MDKAQKKIIDDRIKIIEDNIGHALWEVQGLEQLITKYFSFINIYEIPDFTDKYFRNTLGRIVRELIKVTELDERFERRLDDFVDERNWLVHRIRLRHFNDLMKNSDFQSLIERIVDLSEEARNLIHVFDDLMMEHCKQLGNNLGIIEENQNKLINSWDIS